MILAGFMDFGTKIFFGGGIFFLTEANRDISFLL